MAFVDSAAEGVETEGAVTDAGDESVDGAELTPGETGEAAETSVEEPELYTVRVNGREEQVTLEDALNGWMRQQDYTRKTQEVAQQRESLSQMFALQAALERDPRTTIAVLASSLGVDLGNPSAPQQQSQGEQDPYELLAGKVDNLAASLTAQQQAALRAQQEAQQAAAMRNQVDREIADLKAAHGDFDEKELAQYAVDHGVMNLDVAFRALQFEKAQQQAASAKNRATEAKRKQAAVVSGGHGTAAGAVVPGGGSGRMSIREAWAAAVAATS